MADLLLFICSEWYSSETRKGKKQARKEGRVVKPDHLEPFFNYLIEQLKTHDWKIKDAALMCLGNLWVEISKYADLRQKVEDIVQ